MAFEPTPNDMKSEPSGLKRGKGVILSHAQIERILTVAGRGPVADRNTALVLVMLGNGLGINGLRELRVRDFLHADGSVRRDARLEPTRDSREPRQLYRLSPRVVTRVEAYLASRTPSAPGTALAYRGLDPEAPLFPAHDAVDGTGGIWATRATQLTTNWMSELLCSIFQEAGSPCRRFAAHG